MAVNPIQVQKYLSGIDYPTSKEQLLQHAKEQGADQQVQETLESLRSDRFNSPNDVSEEIGKIN